MDSVGQPISDAIIHKAVSLERSEFGEALRRELHSVMSRAAYSTRVTGMRCAVVDHDECLGIWERFEHACTEFFDGWADFWGINHCEQGPNGERLSLLAKAHG